MKRSSSTVALALLQSRCSPDPEANLKKTLRAAERAAGAGAQIICTQELFRSQYFCQSEDHKYFALARSEEHTSELQSRLHLVCRLLLEKKKKQQIQIK